MKHGMTPKGKRHPLYRVWHALRRRCKNPNSDAYQNYGGRGITICKQWDSNFLAFFHWMVQRGWKADSGHTIERLNNNKGYSPSNCVVATRTAQGRNKRTNKLTLKKANAIRHDYATLYISSKAVGAKYGVCSSTVMRIVDNKLWKPDAILVVSK